MTSRPDVLEHFKRRENAMIAAIHRLVAFESPSSDVEALDACAEEVAKYFEEATGRRAHWHRTGDELRPQLQIDLGDKPDVLLIGHFDTVHPIGTIEDHPTNIEGDRLYGLGALDMKAGVVMIAEIARYITDLVDRPNVTIFLNSDEEIGSVTSGPLLRQIAVGGRIAMVFESTLRQGMLKTGARGIRQLSVTARGIGGHSAYPEHFVNPVDAIGDVILAAREHHDPENGVVVVPTMMHGSEAINTVADEAHVHIDVRARNDELLDQVEKSIRRVRYRDERVTIEVETTAAVPTFVLREDNAALQYAKTAAAQLDMEEPLGIEARGGSDTNQIASIVPDAIEGLGGWGDGLHRPGAEYVRISSLAPSAALGALMVEQCLGLSSAIPSVTDINRSEVAQPATLAAEATG